MINMIRGNRKIKVLVATSVGKDAVGNNYILFPSRWTASVGKTKSFNFYPYELGYLSSLLKKNKKLEVLMVDGNLRQLNAREYYEEYRYFAPDYLVVESSPALYEEDLKFAMFFKTKYKTKLIFCGPQATAYPEKFIKDGVDYVALGEFENAVSELIEKGSSKGVLGIFPNKRGPLIDVDQLPWPEDDDIRRIDYTGIGGSNYRVVEMFATRGCPMNCVFCVARQTYYAKSNFRKREVADVVNEIEYLHRKYPEMEGVFFDEENHNTDKKYILDLCQEIKRRKLDHLHYEAMCGYWTLDEEMVKAMVGAGYYKLRIGIESVSVKTLKGMEKNINVERLIETLRLAKRYGLKMYGTFTFGAPDSNKEEDAKTISMIEELMKKDLLEDFQASVCTPQPGTPFYQWLKDKNYLLTEDWKRYDGGTAVYEYPDYKKEDIERNMKLVFKVYVRQMVRRKGWLKVMGEFLKRDGIVGNTVKLWSYLTS